MMQQREDGRPLPPKQQDVFCDLSGVRVGRLLIIEKRRVAGRKSYSWLARCDCGETTIVNLDELRRGDTQSCGCFRKQAAAKAATIHGAARKGDLRSSTYTSWANMKKRCHNRNHPQWQHYGARGIFVCERWHTFANFLADMGHAPSGLSIERKENDKGYEPGNCVWADDITQARNKRNTIYIVVSGERVKLADAREKYGIKSGAVTKRVCRYGMTTRTCQCESCPECNGSGNVWFTFGHAQYLGNHRSDDLDEMETCEKCRGSRIVFMCDSCQDALDEEMDRD